MKTLVLFDFDGTLTNKDSFLSFIQFYHGKPKYWVGMGFLSPYIALYLAGLYPNWKLKQKVLSWFFKGEPVQRFQDKASRFSREVIPHMIRPGVLDAIQSYRQKGARTLVVSASAEAWLQDWCLSNQLEVIGTRLRVVNDKLTGELEGYNCYGQEKVNRLSAKIDLKDYQDIHVYGDSKGDSAMLKLATQPFYRHFSV